MEKFYYSVSIPVPVRKDFTYSSDERIQAGSRVKVSFNKREVVGVVCRQTSKPAFKTTKIEKLLDEKPTFDALALKTLMTNVAFFHPKNYFLIISNTTLRSNFH